MTERPVVDETWQRRARRAVVVTGAAMLSLAVAGVAAAVLFVDGERERELRQWEIRLGIVADSRLDAVLDWLDQQRGTLRDVSENASVRLYLTELALAGGDRAGVTEEPSQAQYLANLLNATADRGGFAAPPEPGARFANVARTAVAGLLLTDPAGRVLVATAAAPPVDDRLRTLIADPASLAGGRTGPHAGGGGEPVLAFAEPVFAVQGNRGAADLVGWLLGVRPAAPMYARLRQPGDTEPTAETLLVRPEAGQVRYISPLADGTPPLDRLLSRDAADLASARLLEAPGGFGRFRDYAGTPVLALSRAFPAGDWLLVRKVGRDAALGDADRRLAVLLTVLLLAIALAAVAVVAVWRHGTSIRAAAAAAEFRRSTERFEALSRFLRLVTDGQPTEIAALDGNGRVTFANRQAARAAGAEPADLEGRTLAAWKGARLAQDYDAVNRRAVAAGERVTHTLDGEEGGRRLVVKSEHIPLTDADGVLMILEDITGLVVERERRGRTLRQLVDTLVTVVDRRDPYSANHSVRVADVARTVAAEMQLGEADRDTAEFAGALMNLGKILVPEQTLTKTDRLSEAELAQIRDSILTSAELLEAVEFDGPVVETIRQIQEHWDGSGQPRGLAGEAILPPARVVAVANAFVAMVSARAYRAGLDPDAAAAVLLRDAGSRLDRRAVAALLNVLENRGGRERWHHFGAPPPAAVPA